MKLQDRIAVAWGVLTGRRMKSAPYGMATWAAGTPQFSAHTYAEYVNSGYRKNTLVYACIREIARSAAEPRWVVRKGERLAPEHRLQALLERPNRYFSGFELWELLLTYLNLDGNAFLWKERAASGVVLALWPLRPDYVHPVPAESGELLGYMYGSGGAWSPFLPEDVVHFKFPHPGDPLEGLGLGLSPLTVAAREADVDNSATDFLKAFFDNAAVPFGILKSNQVLVDTEVKRIRARLTEQYVGATNWHKMLILDANAEYQRVGLDMTEMAFPELRALSESRICMVFGVPPILVGAKVGLDRATFSNYAEARRSFWEETLAPMYRRLEDTVNARLAPDFGDVRVRVDWSSVQALQESRDALFTRAQTGVAGGWLSVNDARREVGLPLVENGDVFLRPVMMMETPAKMGKMKSQMADSSPGPSRWAGQEQGAVFHRLLNQTARAWERQFVDEARSQLAADADAVARVLRGKSKAAVDFTALGTDVEAALRARGEEWRDGFIPLFEAVLSHTGDAVTATFGLDFAIENPELAAFIRDYGFTFAERMGRTTVEGLRRVIDEGQREGWDVLTLMEQVEAVYEGWSRTRAEMIARSETIRSSNAAAWASYRQSGVTRMRWFTAEDERVCVFCNAMHNREIAIDAVFFDVGQTFEVEVEGEVQALALTYGPVRYPPLHPDCRCTVLPVL